ncbi:uncharacterized protein [Nicotiana sylvestris]|uniref:uncharacterized protein n=1 Tax=Nicotiana sylvestris TaxID=4096 RepID=UPI00388C97A8
MLRERVLLLRVLLPRQAVQLLLMLWHQQKNPGKFSGIDFKRWQMKMLFYLTTLSLQRFIKEDPPVLAEGTPDDERFVVTEAWKHSDFLGKNYILSCLEDSLYNIYSVMETSKTLRNAFEKKYKTEDASLKKFVAASFLDFKMIDTRSVITQVQELQVIVHDLLTEGMVINEAFQVAAFIKKLPPLWKDFKNYLKHKRKEMTLEDLIIRLRIEEDNKNAEKKSRGNSTIIRANIVEEAPQNKKRKNASGPKNYPRKKKFKGNPKEWWIDSGTRHVCANKELFSSYAPAGPDETIFMGNSSTAKIEGVGKIALKMTSEKIVTLNQVLHVSEIRKNFVSTSLLVKNGFKCIFVSNSVVLSKNDVYVGKGYLNEGFFKLNESELTYQKSKRPREEIINGMPNEENPRRSKRQWTSTSFGPDFLTFLLENERRTFKEAMSSSKAQYWKEVVNSEIESILSNHTWELVDLPSGNKTLGSKWISKKKIKDDGTIDKYKARLVVKGFRQREGLDYFDTYSSVTRITSIRMLIALAALYGLQIHQMDVKTAFLNCDLEEEIYMNQPEGFVVPEKEKKVG